MKKIILTLCLCLPSFSLFAVQSAWAAGEIIKNDNSSRVLIKELPRFRCEYIYMKDVSFVEVEKRFLKKIQDGAYSSQVEYVGDCTIYKWSGYRYILTSDESKRAHMAVIIPSDPDTAIIVDLSCAIESDDVSHVWDDMKKVFMENYNAWSDMFLKKYKDAK